MTSTSGDGDRQNGEISSLIVIVDQSIQIELCARLLCARSHALARLYHQSLSLILAAPCRCHNIKPALQLAGAFTNAK